MKTYNIDEIRIEPKSDGYSKYSVMVFGDARNIYTGSILEKCTTGLDIILLNLRSNEQIPEHRHDSSEEIVFVLKGSGWIIQPETRRRVVENDLTFLEKGETHQIKADDGGLRILVIHGPPMHERILTPNPAAEDPR